MSIPLKVALFWRMNFFVLVLLGISYVPYLQIILLLLLADVCLCFLLLLLSVLLLAKAFSRTMSMSLCRFTAHTHTQAQMDVICISVEYSWTLSECCVCVQMTLSDIMKFPRSLYNIYPYKYFTKLIYVCMCIRVFVCVHTDLSLFCLSGLCMHVFLGIYIKKNIGSVSELLYFCHVCMVSCGRYYIFILLWRLILCAACCFSVFCNVVP